MSDKDFVYKYGDFFPLQKSTKITNNNTLTIVKEPLLNKIFSRCHHLNVHFVQEHLPTDLVVHNI